MACGLRPGAYNRITPATIFSITALPLGFYKLVDHFAVLFFFFLMEAPACEYEYW